MPDHYDVIIIGSGAGGGTLAHKLAPSGKRILLLERGGYLPREPQNWDSKEVFGKGRYASGETWIDKNGESFSSARPVLRRRQHEGLRRHPVPPSRGGLRRGGPLRRGLAGVAALIPGLRAVLRRGRARVPRPWSGRRGPHRAPAIRSVPAPAGLARAAHPAARRRLRAGGPPPLSSSDRHRPERVGPRGGALRALRPLRRLPVPHGRQVRRARLLRATRVESSQEPDAPHPNESGASGDRPVGRTVTKVIVERKGSLEEYSADVVVSSCGAINSAALLLRSASARHPNGLANSSDQVGRNYMAHINSGVVAVSQTVNPTTFQKTLGINDYYWGAPDSELPLGHIQMLAKSDRNILRAGAPWFAPPLALDYLARHAIDFWLTTEDLPRPDNRVTLDRQGQHPPVEDLRQPGAAPAAAGQAQGPARAARVPHDGDPALLGARPADPARGHRARSAGRRVSATTRPTRCSTSTAARTTSTTCTSSTRASSRPRARSTPR